MKQSKRASIRLTNTKINLIRSLAEHYEVTQSHIIRHFIELGLQAENKKGTIQHYRTFPSGGM